MKNIKFLLILAAIFSFAACEDDPNGGENGTDTNANYWYRHGFVTPGIKSVTEYEVTETFDQNGRPTGSYSQNSKTTITYNDSGLPSQVVEEYTESDGSKDITTITYEYKNDKDIFFPRPMGYAMFFHLDHGGLAPGLSKVTWKVKNPKGEENTIVSSYTLSGNKLTISTTGELYGSGFDDVEFDYDGAYPVSTSNDMEFLGPFTYQKDGRFDVYIEGFQQGGIVSMKRTRTYSKSFKKAMLPEKEVSIYYDDNGTPWDTETITFKYDEKGNLTEETSTHTSEGSETGKTTYVYKFDAKGNWTECTGTHVVVGKPEIEPNTWTSTRTIEYYK